LKTQFVLARRILTSIFSPIPTGIAQVNSSPGKNQSLCVTNASAAVAIFF
jgi:hypothetical protein